MWSVYERVTHSWRSVLAHKAAGERPFSLVQKILIRPNVTC